MQIIAFFAINQRNQGHQCSYAESSPTPPRRSYYRLGHCSLPGCVQAARVFRLLCS